MTCAAYTVKQYTKMPVSGASRRFPADPARFDPAPVAYNEEADHRSWQAMKDLFREMRPQVARQPTLARAHGLS